MQRRGALEFLAKETVMKPERLFYLIAAMIVALSAISHG